jgi:excisionase family DNA binding protein
MSVTPHYEEEQMNPQAHRSDNQDPDELCTLAEVATLLRVPPATLRYWRHLGSGPRSFRVGRHVRYYRADVDRWLHDRRDAADPGVA